MKAFFILLSPMLGDPEIWLFLGSLDEKLDLGLYFSRKLSGQSLCKILKATTFLSKQIMFSTLIPGQDQVSLILGFLIILIARSWSL